jgi:hypothetical protein
VGTINNTTTEFRWFWAWQETTEAAWLARKSAEGLHLTRPGIFGFYKFAAGEPKQYVYRLDFRAFGKEDLNKYIEIGHKAGWEYLGQFGTWQYFRKDARITGDKEKTADKYTRIALYKRVITYLAFCFFLIAALLMIFLDQPDTSTALSVASWAFALILMFLTYAIIRLIIKIWHTGKE